MPMHPFIIACVLGTISFFVVIASTGKVSMRGAFRTGELTPRGVWVVYLALFALMAWQVTRSLPDMADWVAAVEAKKKQPVSQP